MKSVRLLLSAITIALVLLFTLGGETATAAAKKVAPPPPETFSKVTGVNAKTSEVTIIPKTGTYSVGKKPLTYIIDSLTTITVNNVPGKFSDIKAGMIILGLTERDSHTLDNLTLTTIAPSEVPK